MDIVIISEFCEDFSKSDNDRFFYLAKTLAEENQVEIITSSFHHTTKSQRYEPVEQWSFKITFIDEPGYPRNICLKRFWSHYIWGKNVEKYIRNRKKPDVIYCAVPSLTGPNLVARYCEEEHIRFVIDVQDLWPEAFQMIINIPVMSSIAFKPFKIMADGIYRRADTICAVSDTYGQRALSVNKKCKIANTVFLGTELKTFDKYATGKPLMIKDKEEVWLAYCGTLGSSYDLTCVIDALAIINEPRAKFIVMGDGPRFNEFKSYAEKKGVKAVFTGRLSYDKMCSLLKTCDITINPISHKAAQSIINKHADYAASGLPVISTQENEEYRNLVDNYQMGFNCRNNDPEDLARKINILLNDKEARISMGKNARRCAEEKFDRINTYSVLKSVIIHER